MTPWSVARKNPELWHIPWAENPADPSQWQITQWVHDQNSGQMVKKEGRIAAELFDLWWPGDD